MKKLILLLFLSFLTLSASARQPNRGYRGFLEWSNDLYFYNAPGWGNHASWFTGFSTSHGMQFNRWLFVGAGLEYEYCRNEGRHICAPFIQGRADLKFDRFSPFADIRIGYDLTSEGRIFFSPTVGYRFNWGRKVGINLGIGLTLVNYSYPLYDFYDCGDYYSIVDTGKRASSNRAYLSFRVGFDF